MFWKKFWKRKRTVAIVQARLTSSRFPRKVLADICGKSMVDRVLERVLRSEVDAVVLATPHQVEFDHRLNVRQFIGSENDVLERYHECALENDADYIVRITADCPLVQPLIINRMVQHIKESKDDYVTNRPNMPCGLDVEVFTFKALDSAHGEATEQYDREHVTPYIYRSGKFKCGMLVCHGMPSGKFSVDTEEDLERVRRIYEMGRENNPLHWS